MTSEDYERELASLGIHGPMGELKQNGAYVLVYKMFDGSTKFLPPPDSMSSADRASTIGMLKEHLGLVIVNSRRQAERDGDDTTQTAHPFGKPKPR